MRASQMNGTPYFASFLFLPFCFLLIFRLPPSRHPELTTHHLFIRVGPESPLSPASRDSVAGGSFSRVSLHASRELCIGVNVGDRMFQSFSCAGIVIEHFVDAFGADDKSFDRQGDKGLGEYAGAFRNVVCASLEVSHSPVRRCLPFLWLSPSVDTSVVGAVDVYAVFAETAYGLARVAKMLTAHSGR